MDSEQMFLRVHARLSGMLLQLLTPRIRLVLEYVYLSIAVALFCLIVVMHTNFVQQPGCSSELSGINFTEAQLFQIKITSGELWAHVSAEQNRVNSLKQENLMKSTKTPGVNGDRFTFLSTKLLSHWIGSGAKRSKLIFKYWRSELVEHQVEKVADITTSKSFPDETTVKAVTDMQKGDTVKARGSFKAALVRFCSKWNIYVYSYWKLANKFSASSSQIQKSGRWNVLPDIPKLSELLHIQHLNAYLVQWLERRSKALEPTYLYTSEKGYFLLPEVAKARHNIRIINVTISAENACFGNRWQKLLINSLVGYDTILMNSLLSYPGQGYLYNYQTKEFYDLSYGHESASPARFGDYFVTKCGVLIMSLFVFFTTTMSVSFTLRETQSRMLRFTVHLLHHARHHLPTFQLIFVHVIESLVFVPIMIGILFFLFEFYDDQLLAFLVLTLVWLCELFTMISVRTPISMQFFPRFFLLYFLVFHIYFFSYAYGFSYLAFSATAAFMQHLILYFWNRFEVPALERFLRTRAQFQQQSGVQITASTIYTSTLHIARVNVRNPGQEEPDSPTGLPEGSGAREPGTGRAGSNGSLNPLSSFLLRILGGASSDGIGSFLSMFRDQGRPPPPPPPPQDEQTT